MKSKDWKEAVTLSADFSDAGLKQVEDRIGQIPYSIGEWPKPAHQVRLRRGLRRLEREKKKDHRNKIIFETDGESMVLFYQTFPMSNSSRYPRELPDETVRQVTITLEVMLGLRGLSPRSLEVVSKGFLDRGPGEPPRLQILATFTIV